MAREYFCAYHSLLESLTPYGDAELGRLFRACLQYSMTGEEPDLRGNERFIWPTLKQGIDRDRAAYGAKCESNQRNGLKGGRPRNPKNRTVFTETEKTQEEEKGKEEEEKEAAEAGRDEAEEKGTAKDRRTTTGAGIPPAREAAVEPVNAALGKVFEVYQDNFGLASGVVVAGLRDYTAELGGEVVIHAIEIAAAEKKPGWSYLRGILSRYKREGLRTLADVRLAEQRHEQGKSGAQRQNIRGADAYECGEGESL